MEEYIIYIALFFAGIVAAFVNMMAGGGSIVVLGVMIYFGIDPQVANATNRIGVLAGTTSGALAYKSENVLELKKSIFYSLWTIPGAILGAIFSVSISAQLFQYLLIGVMIFVVVNLFIPSKKDIAGGDSHKDSFLIYPALVLAGFYGGFIQVGVGIVLMSVFRLFSGMSLVKVNMHKVFIVLFFVLPTLVVFFLSGKIEPFYALTIGAGNLVGAWFSVKIAVKKGNIVAKVGMAVSVLLIIAKILFF